MSTFPQLTELTTPPEDADELLIRDSSASADLRASMTTLRKSIERTATAGGTADALTAAFTPAVTTLPDGIELRVTAAAANATTTPTVTVDGLGPYLVTKRGGQALVPGDIYGAGHELLLKFDAGGDGGAGAFELLNPAEADALRGAIVDSGSNTSGSYVRYADGTQIATGGEAFTALAVNASSVVAADSFAAAFISAPKTGTNISEPDTAGQADGNVTAGVTDVSGSGVNYWYTNEDSVNHNIVVEYIAIGYWK